MSVLWGAASRSYWNTRSRDPGLSAVLSHRWTDDQQKAVHDAQVAAVSAALPDRSRLAVDLGCGTGRMIPVLAKVSDAVLGIDASIEMVVRARRDSLNPLCEAFVSDLRALPLRDATVDLALSVSSLQFVNDDDMTIVAAELARACDDDAALILLEGERGNPTVRHPGRASWESFGRDADQYAQVLRPAFSLVSQQRLSFVADYYRLTVWERRRRITHHADSRA